MLLLGSYITSILLDIFANLTFWISTSFLQQNTERLIGKLFPLILCGENLFKQLVSHYWLLSMNRVAEVFKN